MGKCCCIASHHPNWNEFKPGDHWTCPSCGAKYLRIDEKTYVGVWAGPFQGSLEDFERIMKEAS